jgi:hypothetical protein
LRACYMVHVLACLRRACHCICMEQRGQYIVKAYTVARAGARRCSTAGTWAQRDLSMCDQRSDIRMSTCPKSGESPNEHVCVCVCVNEKRMRQHLPPTEHVGRASQGDCAIKHTQNNNLQTGVTTVSLQLQTVAILHQSPDCLAVLRYLAYNRQVCTMPL